MALTIKYKDPAQLRPRASNPRTHTPKQVRQIAESIKQLGFINPVLIDGDGGIVAGHARIEAAKLLAMSDVPTVLAKFDANLGHPLQESPRHRPRPGARLTAQS